MGSKAPLSNEKEDEMRIENRGGAPKGFEPFFAQFAEPFTVRQEAEFVNNLSQEMSRMINRHMEKMRAAFKSYLRE